MTTSAHHFIGKSFLFEYEHFTVRDSFTADKIHFDMLTGELAGLKGEAAYHAVELREGLYLITWQEADGSTVTHVDDFINGISYSNFTDAKLNLWQMKGRIIPVQPD